LCPAIFNRGDGRGGEGLPENRRSFSKQVGFLIGRFYCHLENAFAGAIPLLTAMGFLPYVKQMPAYRH
jgi:hypothetical protein